MAKKCRLVTVLNNGKFHYKCSPARARNMLERREATVVSIDPFIVSYCKIMKRNIKKIRNYKRVKSFQ